MLGILIIFHVDVTLIIAIDTVMRTEGPERVEYRMAGKIRGVDKVLPSLQSLWWLPLIPATRAGPLGAGHARYGH